MDLFSFFTDNLWEELEELRREREQMVELRSIMTKTKLTELTNATTLVIKKSRTEENDHPQVREFVRAETRKDFRIISKSKKKAEVKQSQKNYSAGGKSPAPDALNNGNGRKKYPRRPNQLEGKESRSWKHLRKHRKTSQR